MRGSRDPAKTVRDPVPALQGAEVAAVVVVGVDIGRSGVEEEWEQEKAI